MDPTNTLKVGHYCLSVVPTQIKDLHFRPNLNLLNAVFTSVLETLIALSNPIY